jgi:hypothetical protein
VFRHLRPERYYFRMTTFATSLAIAIQATNLP